MQVHVRRGSGRWVSKNAIPPINATLSEVPAPAAGASSWDTLLGPYLPPPPMLRQRPTPQDANVQELGVAETIHFTPPPRKYSVFCSRPRFRSEWPWPVGGWGRASGEGRKPAGRYADHSHQRATASQQHGICSHLCHGESFLGRGHVGQAGAQGLVERGRTLAAQGDREGRAWPTNMLFIATNGPESCPSSD